MAASIAALHAAVIVAAAASLESWPLVLAIFGALLSGFLSVRSVMQPRRSGVCGLAWDTTGNILWRNVAGDWCAVRKLRTGYISRWLTVIWIQPQSDNSVEGGHWLVLGPGSAGVEELRQLRVLLREKPGISTKRNTLG